MAATLRSSSDSGSGRRLRLPLLAPLLTALAAVALLSAAATPALALAQLPPPASDFNVHSISVNHELGGILHQTSQLHLVQQPDEAKAKAKASRYFIGLSPHEAATLSHSEVNLKLGPGILPEQRAVATLRPEGSVFSRGADDDLTHLYSIDLPPSFLQRPDAAHNVVTPNITIAVDLLFHRVSQPLPKQVAQKQSASLLWEGDSIPRAVYGAGKVRVKARSPSAKIHSHGIEPALAEDADLVTRSGAVVTFGPQADVAPLGTPSTLQNRKARIHYAYEAPIVGLVSLDRHVEISHWGDNAAYEDRLWLRNDGPALKGHFSRVDHQLGTFYNNMGRNTLTDVAIQLPAGVRDPYFIDQIGNVSTSIFRPATPDAATVGTPSHLLPREKASHLTVQPRYPLLGGWNYTFSLGWNLPLSQGGWARRSSAGTYSVAVPFFNAVPKLPIGTVTTRIVLPEGATLLDVALPFEVRDLSDDDSDASATAAAAASQATIDTTTYTTYLDTLGRPALVITKHKASEHDAANIYVTYKLGAQAHLLKPMSVASATLAIFSMAALVRRVSGRK